MLFNHMIQQLLVFKLTSGNDPASVAVGRPDFQSTCSISKASRSILIKFHVNHYQIRGKAALGFWADWIGTLVAMATYSSHRLIMGKNKNLLL